MDCSDIGWKCVCQKTFKSNKFINFHKKYNFEIKIYHHNPISARYTKNPMAHHCGLWKGASGGGA